MSGVGVYHELFLQHDPGPGHPERAARLEALLKKVEDKGDLRDAIAYVPAVPAPQERILAVHDGDYIRRLENVNAVGGGALDADTGMSAHSWEAAQLAAGAGLVGIEAIEQGAEFSFSLVRPPGHHAERDRAMGFCLLNNVGIAARALVDRGCRVVVIDWDAHHGNGTQDLLWEERAAMFVSLHEFPAYPGTGRLDETGPPTAPGTTLNLALPPGTGEKTYVRAFDEAIVPAVTAFAPDWVLLSAGFDAHRSDPITNMGLRAKSFGLLALRLRELALDLTGRGVLAFLEGGYNLHALAESFDATVMGLLGVEGAVDGEAPAADVYEVAADIVDAQTARVHHFVEGGL